MFYPKVAISLIVVGVIILIAGVVVEHFIQTEKQAALYNIFLYSYNDEFKNPNYQQCTSTQSSFYFFNMTNPIEFLNGSSKPSYDQLGPYTYNYTSCIFNAEVVGDLEFYNEWIAEPVLISTGVSDSDRIVYLNPGYVAVVRKFGSQENMVLYITGPSLTKILAGMQSQSFLFEMTPNVLIVVQEQLTLELSNSSNFYEQWTSAYLPNIMLVPSAPYPQFELVLHGKPSSGINSTVASNLWNSSIPYSFTSITGSVLWIEALTSSSEMGFLINYFGLTENQGNLVASWFFNFSTNISPSLLESDFGVSSFSDLAYLQWGTGKLLGGKSLLSYDPKLLIPPEFAIYAESIGKTITFNASFSQWLLTNNSTGLLQNVDNLGLFLESVEMGNFNEIQSIWFLNPTDAGVLAMYFQYFMNGFIDPLLESVYDSPNYLGYGTLAIRTPKEIIWNGTDPLASYLTESSQPTLIGLFSDDTWISKAEAESAPKKNQSIFLGGGSSALNYFLQAHLYHNESTVGIWRSEIPVSGYTGEGLLPGESNQINQFDLWVEDFARPVTMLKQGNMEIYDINLQVYSLDPSTFESSSQDSSNYIYYQGFEGMLNLSSANSIDIWYSRAQWYGVEASVVSNATNANANQNPDYDSSFWIGIEPESGVTMSTRTVIEVSFGYESLTRYSPGLNGYGVVPVLWRDMYENISESEANNFKNSFAKAKELSSLSLGLGIGLGGLLIILGVIIIVLWRKKIIPI